MATTERVQKPKREPWRTPKVAAALEPKPYWKFQPFEYYAAHYLVGSGLTDGDLEAHIRSLAHALQQQYELGVEHGLKSPEFTAAEPALLAKATGA